MGVSCPIRVDEAYGARFCGSVSDETLRMHRNGQGHPVLVPDDELFFWSSLTRV